MIGQINYRHLKPTDYDQVISVWDRAKLIYRPKGRDSREKLIAEIESSPGFFYGAFDNQRMIGVIFGSFDGRKGCINRVAVVPEFRHHGIAQKLIDLCEKELKAVGATVIFCLILDDNTASIELFEKMGFEASDCVLYLSKRDNQEA